MKIHRIRASMIATLPFLLKISITAILFHWLNDKTCLLSPDGVHPEISLSLRLLVICLLPPDLMIIYYCLFIFFKRTHFFQWLP